MKTIVKKEPKKRPGRPPGFKGTSNRTIVYECSKCGAKPGRENLFAKRVNYTTISRPPKSIKSRTVGWLCRRCMEEEPEFNVVNPAGISRGEVASDGD